MLAKSGVDEMTCKKCGFDKKREYEKGRKNGRQDQHTLTINLFNKLRNGRFQFNDEVKMVIDMLKDEMTRELMK
jgi:hypothetical protein